MTNEHTAVLVLKDAAGNYFLLPREALERGRVPEERKGEVEHILAGQQDVRGRADYLKFELSTVVISQGSGTPPPPPTGIGQVIKKMLEDGAENRPQ